MDYTYAGTRASTMASALLNKMTYERLLGAKTHNEGVRILADTFVAPYLDDSKTLDQTLNQVVLRKKEETMQFVPDPRVTSLFWTAYDFFNLAIIRKSELLDLANEAIIPLLYTYGTIDPHVLLNAYQTKDVNRYAPMLNTLFTQIESNTDAQSIDIQAEELYLIYLHTEATLLNIPFLDEYVAVRIDLFNALTALRAYRVLGKTLDRTPFINGGTVEASALSTESDIRSVLARMLGATATDADNSELEKLAQDFLLHWLREHARDTFTIAPLFYLLHRLLSHVGIIRALIRNIQAGIPESETRSFIISLG